MGLNQSNRYKSTHIFLLRLEVQKHVSNKDIYQSGAAGGVLIS